MVETLRTVWSTVEKSTPEHQAKLRKDIADTIRRLKGRIEKKLGVPVRDNGQTATLFPSLEEQHGTPTPIEEAIRPPRFSEPVLRVYAKDFADHALRTSSPGGKIPEC